MFLDITKMRGKENSYNTAIALFSKKLKLYVRKLFANSHYFLL